MAQSIVIYRSKSGYTHNYAKWIAQALHADLVEVSTVRADQLQAYDCIIFGGGLYAGGIGGIKLIKDNLAQLSGKKIIVFATGASPVRDGLAEALMQQNFTADQLAKIRFYYMRGGFDFNKLTIVDKVLMTLMKWSIKRKKFEIRSPDERGMLAAYDQPMDFTALKHIEPILAYARDEEGVSS